MDEVFRVGSFDGDDWETFGEIGGVAFDAAGNLYVFDRQSQRIVKVAPGGSFAAEIGRPGEGPGELRMPLDFVVRRDGSLVVADMGHRAYSLFDTDGEFDRMVSMGGGGGMIRLGQLLPDPSGDGLIAGGGRTMTMSTTGPGGGGPAVPTGRPVERLDLSGADVTPHPIVEAWAPPADDQPQRLEGGGMSFRLSMAGPRTFEPGLHVGALTDGGVAFADTTTYAVRVTDAAGAVQRVLRRPFSPRPVTEAMQEAEKERRLEELEAGGGPQMRIVSAGPGGARQEVAPDAIKEMMRNQVDQMRFYHELPVIMAMQGGWSGKLWVQRRGDAPTDPGPIDVLTPEGRYVGTFERDAIEMPDAFGPDGMVAFIETDEFDVPTVIVRRLPAVLR
jgi:hypothetical protein